MRMSRVARRIALALVGLLGSIAGCSGRGTLQTEPLRPIANRVCDMADSALLYLPNSKLPFDSNGNPGRRTDIGLVREAFEPPKPKE